MQNQNEILSKVPEVILGFWVIKILATTLGETAGDTVTMSWLHADQNARWTRRARCLVLLDDDLARLPVLGLGATVGDFLDKPSSHGGLDLSRPLASGVILALIVVLILVLPQRPGRHPWSSMAAHVQ